ncbi:MAG: hypothetical protein CVV64_11825 [Candidatus Wallbacteria bacterium HGW-Wallbacteria-1]|jgi:signal transduction histidine kinase|uniref:Histidine kinase domain-containing protein n=1 Tax=Candidatus Wallbacteria bacterium HGW-Wallbacteria-1 TaxID=2013854 RepID=A0A2N1PNT9_9BACT|nr:MAG: hypothetical protein CVV64_11825 [Candidatus Wallbacteria bacterium HGW-Wallbacteria-1]
MNRSELVAIPLFLILVMAFANLSHVIYLKVFQIGLPLATLAETLENELNAIFSDSLSRDEILLSSAALGSIKSSYSGNSAEDIMKESAYLHALALMDRGNLAAAYSFFRDLAADCRNSDNPSRYAILAELNRLRALSLLGGRPSIDECRRLVDTIREVVSPREPMLARSILSQEAILLAPAGLETLKRCVSAAHFCQQINDGIGKMSGVDNADPRVLTTGSDQLFLLDGSLYSIAYSCQTLNRRLESISSSLGFQSRFRVMDVSEGGSMDSGADISKTLNEEEILSGKWIDCKFPWGIIVSLKPIEKTFSRIRWSAIAAGVSFFLISVTILSLAYILIWRRIKFLDEARKSREKFLHLLSHELKTPLAAIKLYSDMISSRKDLSPDLFRNSRIISSKASQIGDLITGIICHDRIETLMANGDETAENGLLQPLDAAFLAHTLMDDAMWSYRRSYKLVIRGNTDSLHGDPMLWRVILSNLVDNSFRHIHGSGTVCVFILISVAESTAKGSHVRLIYDDNGMIPDTVNPEELFNVFRKLDHSGNSVSGNSDSGGLGLGLHLVRSLVSSMGGKVRGSRGADGNFRITIEISSWRGSDFSDSDFQDSDLPLEIRHEFSSEFMHRTGR